MLYAAVRRRGLPEPLLNAYSRYQEHLVVRNVFGFGVGAEYAGPCFIPQGRPFSMLFLSILLGPWLVAVRAPRGSPCTYLRG